MLSDSFSKQLVSIVMGVHNEKGEHLRLALDSICNQTYKEIEFIIVDDNSNSICKDILSEYENKYDFIHIIHNKLILGLTKSLNVGIKRASGEFIARMDADDYSLPERIEKQVQFLNDNKDIDICGTGVVSFGDKNVFMSPIKGLSNDEVQSHLFFTSTLCHPSVMIRKVFLKENMLEYDERFLSGQDYDMWERCSVYGKFAVMKEILLYYRIHSAQISATNKNDQDSFADKTRLHRLSRLGIIPSDEEYKCHMLLTRGKNNKIPFTKVQSWVDKLIVSNDSCHFVKRSTFVKELKTRIVLYKLRNRLYKMFTISDIVIVFRIIQSRLIMKEKMYFEKRKLYALLSSIGEVN